MEIRKKNQVKSCEMLLTSFSLKSSGQGLLWGQALDSHQELGLSV